MTKSSNLNSYNFKNDFRTSSYIGLRNFKNPEPNITSSYYNPCRIIQRQNAIHPTNEFTTNQSQYNWKIMNTANLPTATQRADRVAYIKPFVDLKLSSIPRPIDTTNSVYAQSYSDECKRSPYEIYSSSFNTCTSNILPRKSDITIDPEKPGYSKYLDLMATTNMLTYVKHSNESLYGNGIGAKDHITYYNWPIPPTTNNIPFSSIFNERMCNENVSRLCPKLYKFPKQIKIVPHTGMTTETQTNYKEPEGKMGVHLKTPYISEIKKKLFELPNEKEISSKTEYSMHGSGDRIQKYLDVN